MVVRVALSPDPSNRPAASFLPEDLGLRNSSSESDDDDDGSYEGYVVLPQEISEVNTIADDSENDEGNSSDEVNDVKFTFNSFEEAPSFDEATKSELSELWNSSHSSRETDIVIDPTKEQQIKNAMAGFKLPPAAIPPWAAEIPEEEWEEQLKTRVALLNKETKT